MCCLYKFFDLHLSQTTIKSANTDLAVSKELRLSSTLYMPLVLYCLRMERNSHRQWSLLAKAF